MDKPGESHHAKDTDNETNPDEGASSPAPDASLVSNPTPPETKSKPNYAFIKIMELDEENADIVFRSVLL